MASGTILIRTRTSDAFLPVENTAVAVYAPGAHDGRTLLAFRITDSSGRTAPVVLEAPSNSHSRVPEGEDAPKPYRTVDISADHPDYEPVTVDGVQVFDGVVTYQDIMLVPLGDPAAGHRPAEIFDIPGQDL